MTATENYFKVQNDIKELLEILKYKLLKHEELFNSNPSWGYVGDLGHVKSVLSELKEF